MTRKTSPSSHPRQSTSSQGAARGQRSRPTNAAPLEWKKWPDPSVPLIVEDLDGRYSFVCPSPHGSYDAIRVRRWEDRLDPMAVQLEVGAERVLIPIALRAGTARTATKAAAHLRAG